MKKKRVHFAFGPAGYRWNFYNGILQYLLDNDDKFDVITMSGVSSGCCALRQYSAAKNEGGDMSRESIAGITWVAKGGMFRTTLKSLFNLHYWEMEDSYRASYTDIIGIQKCSTEMYLTAYHPKRDTIKYFRLKDYYTRKQILDIEAAACAIPHIILSPLGNKKDGYWVDAAVTNESYPLRIMKKPEYKDDLKVICASFNPHVVFKTTVSNFIENNIITPLILKNYPRKVSAEECLLKTLERNPDYSVIMPSESNSHYFDGSFKIDPKTNRMRFLEGYTQAEKTFKNLV